MPPAYSAVKLGGRRAYAMARAGETPELKPRAITIHRLELVDWDDDDPDRPIAVIEVDCSAGTYVRSIARDLGRAIGGAAYLGALTRTALRRIHAGRGPPPRRDPRGGRGRPAGLRPLLLPIDAGLDRFARVALANPRSPRSAGASSSARSPACPASTLPTTGSSPWTVAGVPVAVATIRDGRLAPDKVLVETSRGAAVAVGDA